jgi:hypothetical protein
MRAEIGVQSPPVAHGLRRTGHEMSAGLLNSPQSLWLSGSCGMLFLKGHEYRLVSFWSIPFHKRFLNRPQSFRCDLTVPYFFSHRSIALLRVIRLMVLETQLITVSHAGSRVTCHSFLNLLSSFSRLSGSGRSLFSSESVILLVDSLYAEAIEAGKSQSYLQASSP